MMRFFLLISAAVAVNPISKVIAVLDKERHKVTELGHESQKEYNEFVQWCESQNKDLAYALKTSKSRFTQVQATMAKAQSDIQEATSKIDELSKSGTEIENEQKKTSALRNQQRATYTTVGKELSDTVSALERAHEILERQLKGQSFAQLSNEPITTVLSSLDEILSANSINLASRGALTSLLQADGESQSSSGIMDTLDNMIEKARDQRGDLDTKETNENHVFQLVQQSLKTESLAVEQELTQNKSNKAKAEEVLASSVGEAGIVKKSISTDTTALEEVHHDCMSRATDYETEVKERDAELKVLAQAKNIIQQTTGGAADREYSTNDAFVQLLSVNSGRVAAILRHAGLELLAQQVSSSLRAGEPFGQVTTMIKNMITKLTKEAEKESSQKQFCDEQMSKTKKKHVQGTAVVEDLNTRKEKTQSTIAQLRKELTFLQKELQSIQSSQAEMNKMRSQSKKLNAETETDYSQALDGLQQALKLIRDYYAKGDDESLMQTSTKSSDAANSIIDMLEIAESDFSKTLAETRATEEEEANNYDKETNENKVRIATDQEQLKSKTLLSKKLENNESENTQDLETANAELDAVNDSLTKLKSECETKPDPYEERMKRRQNTIEGLKEALSALGEEASTPSFLALRRVHHHI